MDLRTFYKEHYALEISRRQELTNGLALPLGVLSLVVGALVVVAKEVHAPLDFWACLLLASLLLCFACCVVAAIFLCTSYFNYTYGYIASPQVVKAFRESLIQYHQALGKPLPDATLQADVETLDYIDREYTKYADQNTNNNDRKAAYLHKANGAVIAAVVTGSLAGVLHIALSITTAATVPKVEITNLKEAVMATNPSPSPAPAPTTQQTPQPPAPVRPSEPPGRQIKEHVDPTTRK